MLLLTVGHLLVERYQIVSLLARGSAGATYRAWDQRGQRSVAIKAYLDTSDETRKLFRKEARGLMGLQLEGVVHFVDHFSVDDQGLYLVSEFVEGVNLAALVEQYGSLPVERVVVWMQAACEAVGRLHSKDHLHLDIKPANFIIRPNLTPILVDSGLPALGIAAGSKGYAPPEQQSQRAVTEQSDIYALGATLYTLLTGNIPPDGLARETGLIDLKPAREVNPTIDPYLSIIAQRAMSLQPELRFENVVALANALARPRDVPAVPAAARTAATLTELAEAANSRPEKIYTIPARRMMAQRKRRGIEKQTIWALGSIFLMLFAIAAAFGYVNLDRGKASAEKFALATITTRSQIAQALTEVAPTATIIPTPSPIPTATPEPLTDPKSGAQMIFIAGGTFRMGLDESDDDDNQPQHKVKLDPYFIDQTEVTNSTYATCVEAGTCAPPQRRSATFHPNYYGEPAYADYPVIFVTWYQAQNFCEWRGGRLPSEAEWEYAAGFKPAIAQKLIYPWGNVMNEANANFCDTNCTDEKRNVAFDDGQRGLAPVATYPNGVSSFAVHDMAGNVMEWVFDWYGAAYYAESSNINPLGLPDGDAKVLRGGSWLSTLEGLEVTIRRSFVPEVARANIGFRCAMVAE